MEKKILIQVDKFYEALQTLSVVEADVVTKKERKF